MFDLTPEKILVLAILALVVLGPNRLPQAARTAGHLLGQLRRMSASFQSEVREALAEPTDAFTSAVGDMRPSELRRNVRETVASTFLPAPPSTAAPPPATAPLPGPEPLAVGMPQAPDDPSLN